MQSYNQFVNATYNIYQHPREAVSRQVGESMRGGQIPNSATQRDDEIRQQHRDNFPGRRLVGGAIQEKKRKEKQDGAQRQKKS